MILYHDVGRTSQNHSKFIGREGIVLFNFLLSLLISIPLISTIAFSQGYFPTSVGNEWILSRKENGVTRQNRNISIISDTIMPNNIKYFLFQNQIFQTSPFNIYYRQEGTRVFSFNPISLAETIECDFSKRLGDTIYFSDSRDVLKIVNDFKISNVLGRPLQQWSIKTSYPNNPMPFYQVLIFTDSLGVTGIINANETTIIETCYYAKIDGIEYGTMSGISGEDLSKKQDLLLYRNYPNPFNSSTKISWLSPLSSWQTLKVYDVLGNEIRTLVNEEKEAGYHSIDFDASGLTSGIYFYRIQSENFIDTKKMLLLK